MPKVNVKIPKGTKCNNGEVCTQDLDLDLDIPETRPVIQTIPQPEINIPNAGSNTVQIPPIQTPPPQAPPPQNTEQSYSTDELADLLPTGTNFAVCKGKNCADSIIKNKKFTTKFKSCPKCGCNNVPWNSDLCPCCGKQADEDEEDYWEDSDIEIEVDEDG